MDLRTGPPQGHRCQMGTFGSLHLTIIAAVIVLVLVFKGDLGFRFYKSPSAPTSKDMTPTTAFTLSGELLFALSFLADVYGDQRALGFDPVFLMAGLAGLGAVLLLIAAFLAWRSRSRRR